MQAKDITIGRQFSTSGHPSLLRVAERLPINLDAHSDFVFAVTPDNAVVAIHPDNSAELLDEPIVLDSITETPAPNADLSEALDIIYQMARAFPPRDRTDRITALLAKYPQASSVAMAEDFDDDDNYDGDCASQEAA